LLITLTCDSINQLSIELGLFYRIVNNEDHGITERVLLNLRTSQTFENVLEDLGQVNAIVVVVKTAQNKQSKSLIF